jgi:hypothetical protein
MTWIHVNPNGDIVALSSDRNFQGFDGATTQAMYQRYLYFHVDAELEELLEYTQTDDHIDGSTPGMKFRGHVDLDEILTEEQRSESLDTGLSMDPLGELTLDQLQLNW